LEIVNPGQNKYKTLPSWVPDWSVPRDFDESYLLRLQMSGMYAASRGQPRVVRFNGRTLATKALKVAVIDVVGDAMNDPHTMNESQVYKAWWALARDYYSNSHNQSVYDRYDCISQVFKTVTDYTSHFNALSYLCSSLDKRSSSADTSWFSGFWRTLFADICIQPPATTGSNGRSGAETCQTLDYWSNLVAARRCIPSDVILHMEWTHDLPGQLVKTVEFLMNQVESIFHQSREELHTHASENEFRKVLSQLMMSIPATSTVSLPLVYQMIRVATVNRRFFISKEGFMGLCPKETRKGDAIFIVAGVL
jgi:hypothetical protein